MAARIDDAERTDPYRSVDPRRGARITEAMRRRGLTYNCQLCYDIGVAESTLSRWRAGKPITLENALALSQALQVSLDYLFFGEEYPAANNSASDLREFCAAYSDLDRKSRGVCRRLLRSLLQNAVLAERSADCVQEPAAIAHDAAASGRGLLTSRAGLAA